MMWWCRSNFKSFLGSPLLRLLGYLCQKTLSFQLSNSITATTSDIVELSSASVDSAFLTLVSLTQLALAHKYSPQPKE